MEETRQIDLSNLDIPEMLAEIERLADEPLIDVPTRTNEPKTPQTPAVVETPISAERPISKPASEEHSGGWGASDIVVLVIAIGVFSASGIGLWYLFAR